MSVDGDVKTPKVKTTEEMRSLRAAMRQRGRRLVLTNGCFELLHVGHVRYLQAARALGDALVVGLNSDESVRVLKPEGAVDPSGAPAAPAPGGEPARPEIDAPKKPWWKIF